MKEKTLRRLQIEKGGRRFAAASAFLESVFFQTGEGLKENILLKRSEV